MKNNQALQVVVALAAAGLTSAATAASPLAAPQLRPAAPVARPAAPAAPAPRTVQIKDLMPVHKPQPTPIPVAPPPVPMPTPRAQLTLQPGTHYGVAPAVVIPLKRAEIEIKGPDLHPKVLPPEPGIGVSVTVPLPERK